MRPVVVAGTAGMSRAQWLDARRGIGGSDVPKILGLSPYGGPLSVWAEKTATVPPEDREPSEAAYWGGVLEDVVAREFARRTGLSVARRNAIFAHPERAWMRANVDRVVRGRNQGLECKTASAFKAGEWEGDEIPNAYYLQVQHYMAVMGWASCWVAVLIGGQRFVSREVARNDALIRVLLEREADFWGYVTRREPPPVAWSDDVAAVYPADDGRMLPATDEAVRLAERLYAARERQKAIEEERKELEGRLRVMIGEASGIAGVATWKATKGREEVDWDAVASEMAALLPDGGMWCGEIRERHTRLKPGRPLLFRWTPQTAAEKEAA